MPYHLVFFFLFSNVDLLLWMQAINNSRNTFLMQESIRLTFFSQPDGPIMGNGGFKSSTLIPGYDLILEKLVVFLNSNSWVAVF